MKMTAINVEIDFRFEPEHQVKNLDISGVYFRGTKLGWLLDRRPNIYDFTGETGWSRLEIPVPEELLPEVKKLLKGFPYETYIELETEDKGISMVHLYEPLQDKSLLKMLEIYNLRKNYENERRS